MSLGDVPLWGRSHHPAMPLVMSRVLLLRDVTPWYCCDAAHGVPPRRHGSTPHRVGPARLPASRSEPWEAEGLHLPALILAETWAQRSPSGED